MLFVKIIIAFLLIYFILLLILPKGNPVQEIIYLLYWWAKIYSIGFLKQAPKQSKHSYGKHRHQYLIFWEPEKPNHEKKNVILYFHGGGWQFGRPEGFRLHAQQFTKEGYYSFFPCHRKVPMNGYYEMREDISLVIKKVKGLMQEKGLAHKKIILGGISSGGNLGALLYLDESTLRTLGFSQAIFSALFLAGAPLDLNKMGSTPNLRYFAGKRNSATFHLANPIAYLKKPIEVPVLCLQGSHDGLVKYQVANSFMQQAEALESPNLTFQILKNGSHLDSASWCFEQHESWTMIREWLLILEKR